MCFVFFSDLEKRIAKIVTAKKSSANVLHEIVNSMQNSAVVSAAQQQQLTQQLSTLVAVQAAASSSQHQQSTSVSPLVVF